MVNPARGSWAMWIVLYVATIATLSAMGPSLLPLEMDKESESEGDVVGAD